MDNVRLFLGTYVDSEIFEFAYDEIKDDFAGLISGKWVEPENLHFTWHFIGETGAENAKLLKIAISEKLTDYQSPIIFKGLGTFPGNRHPKVLYASMQYDKKLFQNLFNELSIIMQPFGYQPENRPFSPHLTLIRVKDLLKWHEFQEKLESYRNYSFGQMNSFSINLIESRLTTKGPVYKFF